MSGLPRLLVASGLRSRATPPDLKGRKPLGELDPNSDLSGDRRFLYKRAPITYDQENKHAAAVGIQRGIYDFSEILGWTNHQIPGASASTGIPNSQDVGDSEPTRVTGVAFGNADSEDEFPMFPEEVDDDIDDDDEDELLVEGMDEDLDDVQEDEEHDEQIDSDEPMQAPAFDPTATGLKEINNLAHFGVSSHKPGNGVDELLSDDLDKYWQSDGAQPHLLTIHFVRRVEIRSIRFYVDYNQDESYTPTHIVFYAGTGNHDLIQFAEVPLSNPVGWQDVPIADCGGGPDGHSLCCWLVQMHVKENHQNGKDTHIRGIKIFALDESASGGVIGEAIHEMGVHIDKATGEIKAKFWSPTADDDEPFQELIDSVDFGGANFPNYPDFMRDPEIR
ncbi:anaphase-promoting complex subunit 10 [Echria macrotheca]|uniref:Anaphase-promoting complex subunit 10 n=1 Tax=Echria macrotheca TaxID=438768 RepID=A0AAJ0BR74_9PEZI|nr:anaphase-promoting complex subunit 10 [Echria macrotheca]